MTVGHSSSDTIGDSFKTVFSYRISHTYGKSETLIAAIIIIQK